MVSGVDKPLFFNALMMSIERVGAGLEEIPLPLTTLLIPGEVVVISFSEDLEVGTPAGYLLKYGNTIFDQVATNGYELDGFDGSLQGGDLIRTYICDHNSSEDWSIASDCDGSSLGILNEGLPVFPDNGNVASMQNQLPSVTECHVHVLVEDFLPSICGSMETITLSGSDIPIEAFTCVESSMFVDVEGVVGNVYITNLDLTYPDLGNITAMLTSPNGASVQLFSNLCDQSADMLTNLSDSASMSIQVAPCALLKQNQWFISQEEFATFYGEQSNGEWTLRLMNEGADVGMINNWELHIQRMISYTQVDTIIAFEYEGYIDDKTFEGVNFAWEYSGLGSELLDSFDVGVHKISWEVQDLCGNITRCSYLTEVRNVKSPTPVCVDGISVDLTPMDTNGDTQADTAMAIITAEQLGLYSHHSCGYDISLSFSDDIADDTLFLDCGDVGTKTVEVWATDINGNQAYCTTHVQVTSNRDGGFCDGDSESLIDIEGEVTYTAEQMMSEVNMYLKGAEIPDIKTNALGEYAFIGMSSLNNYELIPGKMDDYSNGVSTLDFIMIQRHILEVTPFDSPLQILSADVNNDKKLSANDLLMLRKLILGVIKEFPNHNSWEFVKEDFKFLEPQNPWLESIPSTHEVESVYDDVVVDWIGYKIGDVNGDAVANRYEDIGERSTLALGLTVEDLHVDAGQEIIWPVRVDMEDVRGLQIDLRLEGLEVLEVMHPTLDMSGKYLLTEDGIRLCTVLTTENGDNDYTDDVVALRLLSNRSGSLSKMISVNEKVFASEAYVANELDVYGLRLDWFKTEDVSDSEWRVSQNNPNPWSDNTQIDVEIPEDGTVKIQIQDISGKVVFAKAYTFKAGRHRLQLTNRELPYAGLYTYIIQYNDDLVSKNMIKLR